ncbi:Short-chain dehydrogenase/reductase sat3 [Alternaria viburni]|uniref:Short-chain dehydrogenase/reductase sat3 n=1 Tax=Alternaria viburni TaxID=566460 RepID=UPI0020C38F44|nr:Short-chain dehydrogenase/reductase sat3 [Alternaria viburni]KAI4647457.1 Short-chain dehydrogenase/reductase sat3 [Alternaria viburni]
MDTSQLFSVEGMIAVVTGGGTGIGLMIARALACAGASKIYILGRREDKLSTAASQHENIIPLQCDITSKASLQAAVDFITQDMGYINLLVANSGIYGPPSSFMPCSSVKELREHMFEKTSMEDFTQTFHVNTTATYFTMLAFLELLDAGNKNAIAGGFGKPLKEGSKIPSIQSQVIITSSVGAFLREWQCAPAYAGSKAAIMHLVKHTSTGLAPHGIRVNALAPGFFPSEMANAVIEGRNPSTESVDDPNFIPARRFGGEEEMGGTVLYLASRAGSFCNGLVLVNEGGRLGVTTSSY